MFRTIPIDLSQVPFKYGISRDREETCKVRKSLDEQNNSSDLLLFKMLENISSPEHRQILSSLPILWPQSSDSQGDTKD
jgi:hypothetical protein